MSTTDTISTEALAALLDKEAIRTVLNRYCRAIDRADAELFETIYHPDAWEHHGNYVGSAAGFRAHSLARAQNPEGWRLVRHSLGSINIDLDGDVAYTETYFHAACIPQRKDDEPETVRVHYGRYIDRFERRDGEWRIAHRVVVKDYLEMRPVAQVEGDGYPRSVRNRDDLVYRRDLVQYSGS